MAQLPPRPAVFLSAYWLTIVAGFLGFAFLNTGSPRALLLAATVWMGLCRLLATAIWLGWAWRVLLFASGLPAATGTPRATANLRAVVRVACLAVPAIMVGQFAWLVIGHERAVALVLGGCATAGLLGLTWVAAVGISDGMAAPDRSTAGARAYTALNLLLAPLFAASFYARLKSADSSAAPPEGQ